MSFIDSYQQSAETRLEELGNIPPRSCNIKDLCMADIAMAIWTGTAGLWKLSRPCSRLSWRSSLACNASSGCSKCLRGQSTFRNFFCRSKLLSRSLISTLRSGNHDRKPTQRTLRWFYETSVSCECYAYPQNSWCHSTSGYNLIGHPQRISASPNHAGPSTPSATSFPRPSWSSLSSVARSLN